MMGISAHTMQTLYSLTSPEGDILSNGRGISFLLSCMQAWVRPNGSGTLVTDATILTNLDWKFLMNLAENHRLLPFVALALQDGGVLPRLPPETQHRLVESVREAALHNLVRTEQFRQLNEVLEAEDIPLIPLKGLAFSHLLYKDRPVRLMRDIDILVQTMDRERVSGLLEAEGFGEKPILANRWHDDLARRVAGRTNYVRDAADWDVQWTPRFLIGGKWVEWDYKRAWDRREPAASLGTNVFMLSGLDHACYLVLQILHDVENEIPVVAPLLDLAMLMRHDHLSAEAILEDGEALRSSGVLAPAKRLLHSVERYFLIADPLERCKDVVQEWVEMFFRPRSDGGDTFLGRAYLGALCSPLEKGRFCIGYVFPSGAYLERIYGRGLRNGVRGYSQHLGRLWRKGTRLLLSGAFRRKANRPEMKS